MDLTKFVQRTLLGQHGPHTALVFALYNKFQSQAVNRVV